MSPSYIYFFYSIAKSTERTTAAISSRANRAALRRGVQSVEEESILIASAVPSRSTRARANKSAPVSKATSKAAPKAAPKAALKAAPKSSKAVSKALEAPPKPTQKSSRKK